MRRILPLLFIVLPLTGCITAAAGTGYMTAQDRPIEDGVSDLTASQGLRNILTRRDMDANSNDFAGVRVKVVEGLALLVGTVPTEEIRTTVETLARTQPRITSVVNELKVSDSYGGAVTDAWVATRIRAALSATAGVRWINYTVEVDDGVAYLLGRARDREELGRATEAAARISGVEQVVSFVRVEVPGAPVTPAAP